ncbi:aldo/keto reductase [Fictibacillus nanhaiensis]|uniref:aldo/keto reductase n=1 Tax=Fictibacillus nanhaiensis TaxID=742169 RepID=UPI003C1F2BEA
MKYKSLGKSGLKVSRLVLGTMNFGNFTSREEAFKIMDAAVNHGINFFDTANVYGNSDSYGLTEEIIGDWFAQGNNRRQKVILGTKVYGDMNDIDGGQNDDSLGLSAYKIKHHLEASLKRLKTDHIELYQLHHIDRDVPWEEIWGELEKHTMSGKIDYVGSSNFAAWDLAIAQSYASKRNFLGLISEQHKYNLLCRIPELEVLPAASHLGIGIIPYSPLSGGLLGGSALQNAGPRSLRQAERLEKHRPQLEEYSKFCSEIGLGEDTVALAWLLANTSVTSTIIGPRNVEQLEKCIKATEVNLSEDMMDRLDEIFPSLGGKAPEAYAW